MNNKYIYDFIIHTINSWGSKKTTDVILCSLIGMLIFGYASISIMPNDPERILKPINQNEDDDTSIEEMEVE